MREIDRVKVLEKRNFEKFVSTLKSVGCVAFGVGKIVTHGFLLNYFNARVDIENSWA